MDGTPTWREQYDRVKRWRARLGERTGVEDRRVDDFYAFFSTCFHLKDWLKQDNSLPESVRADVETHVNATFWLKLCADLANGSKHLELSRPRVDPKARVGTQGPAFQPGAFQANAFQTKPIVRSMLMGRRGPLSPWPTTVWRHGRASSSVKGHPIIPTCGH
jgi:hypothetical protein